MFALKSPRQKLMIQARQVSKLLLYGLTNLRKTFVDLNQDLRHG